MSRVKELHDEIEGLRLQEEHNNAVILEYRTNLGKVIADLCDAGFKNPQVTFETAYSYLENPTIPGYPEKQKVRRP